MAAKKKTTKSSAKKSAKPKAATKAAPKAANKAKPAKPTSKKPASKSKPRVAKAPKLKTIHEIVHWEIQGREPEKLWDFYRAAFNWNISSDNPMQYGMVTSREREGINGGIGGSGDGTSRVVVYTEVPSIPEVLERIESLGGKTVMPRTDIGPVIMALYQDPEGNTMGLLEPGRQQG